MPQITQTVKKTWEDKNGKRFSWIIAFFFLFESIIIGIGSVLLSIFHHPEFLLPSVAIVVGLHFLPLAKIFHIYFYYLTGILLILIGLIVMLFIPVHNMIGNLRAWDVLVDSLSSFTVWVTGIYIELQGRSFLKDEKG